MLRSKASTVAKAEEVGSEVVQAENYGERRLKQRRRKKIFGLFELVAILFQTNAPFRTFDRKFNINKILENMSSSLIIDLMGLYVKHVKTWRSKSYVTGDRSIFN